MNNQPLRLGLAQINTCVGDFDGNLEKMKKAIEEARRAGVEILAFPELAVCGYPPEDLLMKPQFIQTNLEYLQKLIRASAGMTVIAGFVDSSQGKLYNAAAVIYDGRLADVYHKTMLPNYGVFDEKRYFCEGSECPVYEMGDITFGVNICEDIWCDPGPATTQARGGAKLIINISASPYHYRKAGERQEMLLSRAQKYNVFVAYANLVGGQDELVFDGNSLVVDSSGAVLGHGAPFAEDLVITDLELAGAGASASDEQETGGLGKTCETRRVGLGPRISIEKHALSPRAVQELGMEAEIYAALVLGTRDYFAKNGFKKAALGLSGGIDSSIVATIAVDALGDGNVIGVAMPSRYSSPGSVEDAVKLAQNLGIRLITLPIELAFTAYLDTLADVFRGRPMDSAEENIQARIRGNFLMALSNKFGWLVLPTGNKSEMATGYATLYGDMAGGFAILKDVPKTTVYKLAAYRNAQAGYDIIPQAVIIKPPSAELRPNQKDVDSLPPYELLDPVIKAYAEEDRSVEEMIAAGMDEKIVRRAVGLIDNSEYKRRQSPPGIKITARAFGRDRRLPITNKFKGNG